MNPKVIEAAATAILTEFGEVPYYRDMAESAIRAADAARADDVRAALWKLIDVYARWYKAIYEQGDESDAAYQAAEDEHTARRDLLELLGIPEDGA